MNEHVRWQQTMDEHVRLRHEIRWLPVRYALGCALFVAGVVGLGIISCFVLILFLAWW